MSCCCGGSGKGCKQQNQCDSWRIKDGSEYQEENAYGKMSKQHSLFNIGSNNINFIITTEHPCRKMTRNRFAGIWLPRGYTYSFTKIIFLEAGVQLLPPDITISCDGAIAAYYYSISGMNRCNFSSKCCKCVNGGYYNSYLEDNYDMPAIYDIVRDEWRAAPICISKAMAPFYGESHYTDGISFPKAIRSDIQDIPFEYGSFFGTNESGGASAYNTFSRYRENDHGPRQRVPVGSCNTKFTYQNQGEVLDFTSTHFDSIYRYTYGNNLGALGEKRFKELKKTSPEISEVAQIYTICDTYYFVHFKICFLPMDLEVFYSSFPEQYYIAKVPSFLRCDAKFDIINHDSNKCNKEYTDQYLIEPHYICSNKRFFL